MSSSHHKEKWTQTLLPRRYFLCFYLYDRCKLMHSRTQRYHRTGIRWHPVVRYRIFRTVHSIVGAGSVDSLVLCGDDVQQQLTSVIMSSTSSEWSALHDYIACGTDRRFWLETVSSLFPCFDGFWSLVRAITMSDSYEYPSGSESCVNSTLNSLDFWDYTIELECLRQPSGIWIFPCSQFIIIPSLLTMF